MVSIDEPYKDITEEYVNLNKLWHSYKEFPSNNGKEWENKRIVYKTEDGYFNCVTVGDYNGWKPFVIEHKLEEWAYIEELYYQHQ